MNARIGDEKKKVGLNKNHLSLSKPKPMNRKDSLTIGGSHMKFSKVVKSLVIAGMACMGSVQASTITVGGIIQTINSLTATGQLSLDFSSPATDLTIASFVISNNTTSFDLALTFTNGGAFCKSPATGHAAAGCVPLTALTLKSVAPVSGAPWGAGMADLVPGTTTGGATFAANSDLFAQIFTGYVATPTVVTWSPANQTSATVGGQVDLHGTWAASALLAGSYNETITAVLTLTP